MGFFFQGLTLGLAYVAPIGMQNLFVIDSALTKPRRRALLTALIVLFFDASLSLSCFFGIGRLMLAPVVDSGFQIGQVYAVHGSQNDRPGASQPPNPQPLSLVHSLLSTDVGKCTHQGILCAVARSLSPQTARFVFQYALTKGSSSRRCLASGKRSDM